MCIHLSICLNIASHYICLAIYHHIIHIFIYLFTHYFGIKIYVVLVSFSGKFACTCMIIFENFIESSVMKRKNTTVYPFIHVNISPDYLTLLSIYTLLFIYIFIIIFIQFFGILNYAYSFRLVGIRTCMCNNF